MYKGEANCGGILLKNGPIPASFCFIFVLFLLQFQYKIEKSVDGVLGIRTWGRRMVGTDETMELWRLPTLYVLFLGLFSEYLAFLPRKATSLMLWIMDSISFCYRWKTVWRRPPCCCLAGYPIPSTRVGVGSKTATKGFTFELQRPALGRKNSFSKLSKVDGLKSGETLRPLQSPSFTLNYYSVAIHIPAKKCKIDVIIWTGALDV